MTKVQISRLDIAELLTDEEIIQAYLNEYLEDGTPAEFVQALNTVARARGMNNIAQQAGIGRTTLYRTLNSEKPRFETLKNILDAMGYKLTVVAKEPKSV